MGTLVCVVCNSTVEHFDNEKVSVLYTQCPNCKTGTKKNNK